MTDRRVSLLFRYILLFLSSFILFLACCLLGWFYWHWHYCADSVLQVGSEPAVFDLSYGTSVTGLSVQLKQQKLIANRSCVIWLARLKGITHKLQAGTYRIMPGTTLNQLLYQMSHGQVLLRRFTVVDGWTFDQLMAAINSDPDLKHTLAGKSDRQIMQALGMQRRQLEGQFLPDTYLFATGIDDVVILRKAHQAMDNVLQKAWTNRAANLFYKDAYSALIVASMVEKETAKAQEKPQIAGVLLRRLRNNMRLQVDPTVIYGLGKAYKGHLTKRDLLVNTPYNTYVHRGLPPTPIAMPDKASIVAATQPAQGTALYYVATGDGGHLFSTTLSQHNLAVARYRWVEKNKERIQAALQYLAFPSCPLAVRQISDNLMKQAMPNKKVNKIVKHQQFKKQHHIHSPLKGE